MLLAGVSLALTIGSETALAQPGGAGLLLAAAPAAVPPLSALLYALAVLGWLGAVAAVVRAGGCSGGVTATSALAWAAALAQSVAIATVMAAPAADRALVAAPAAAPVAAAAAAVAEWRSLGGVRLAASLAALAAMLCLPRPPPAAPAPLPPSGG
jgi:hypothetical protein